MSLSPYPCVQVFTSVPNRLTAPHECRASRHIRTRHRGPLTSASATTASTSPHAPLHQADREEKGYNYIHENGDGILLCQFAFGDAVVRYNVLQNNSRYQIYLHSDKAASASIYNNTVYNNKASSGVAYGYGDSLAATYVLRNNIFFAAAGNGMLTTSPTITFQTMPASTSRTMAAWTSGVGPWSARRISGPTSLASTLAPV